MPRVLLVLAIALCVSPAWPAVGFPGVPPWLALGGGLAYAVVFGVVPSAVRRATPRLLAASVIGLGAGMNLGDVAAAGSSGFVYTLLGIAFALGTGWLLGRLLGVRPRASLLIAVGTAICGGSAIAAAAPVLRAEEEDVSVALGTVFVLNAFALVLFPAVGHFFSMGERAFGLWAALAIHDTSSVVGAASAYGPVATNVATVTKLARALWIVPVTMGLVLVARAETRTTGGDVPRPKRPWFILGFVAAAALVTMMPVLAHPGAFVAGVARRVLVATLFLIGAGVSRTTLRRVGVRPFLQGLLLWLVVATASFALIRAGWVG